MDNWEKGDILLVECGPASTPGKHDGSRQKLIGVAKRLWPTEPRKVGILSQWRLAASNFQERRPDVATWTAHLEALHPKVLNDVIDYYPSGTRITAPLVREWRRRPRNAPQPSMSAVRLSSASERV